MIAKSTALLYADLGIGKSHSRLCVSDDTPFSEAACSLNRLCRPSAVAFFTGRAW